MTYSIKKGGKVMARRARLYLQGVPQHVVQRGNNNQPAFFLEADYEFYLACLSDAAITYGCDIHAYALMPNHVHLLTTPRSPESIPKMVQSIGRRYVHYINATYRRTGTLWNGRYLACLVDPAAYLLNCSLYIELNPLRAGLVDDCNDYAWSSYRYHALGEKTSIVTPHAQYSELGAPGSARQTAYRELCRRSIDQGILKEIRASINSGRVLGSPAFMDYLEKNMPQPVRPGKPGRPRTRSPTEESRNSIVD